MFVIDADKFVENYLDYPHSPEYLKEAVYSNVMVLSDKLIAKWVKYYTTDCEGEGAPFEYRCSNCGYSDTVLKPKCPESTTHKLKTCGLVKALVD